MIIFKGTVTVSNTETAGAAVNNTNKTVIFKNCAPFINCITEIYNTQADKFQDIDIVMLMYNTIEMNQLKTIITILLIFLLITIKVFHSNLNGK